MKVQRLMLGSALLILSGCQSVGGESMPTVTRTGEVKDVIIREEVSPTSLTVNPGDEIRWINKRQGDVKVIFLNPMTENLACQRNFGGGIMGMGTKRNEYTAKLGSNDTASVCFRDPGEVKYVVRAASNDPSGEQNLPGTIVIGGERREAARESAVERRDRRAEQVEEPAAPR